VRVLLTNDDGIASPGLHALATAVHGLGHEVVVVAPQEDMSGVGAAIGRIRADQRIDTRPEVIPGAPGVAGFSLAGPPGLAVMAACVGAFGPIPDLVVSGVNSGPNTGHACLHSGTVGAALTAATWGISGLATSANISGSMHADEGTTWHWDTACGLIAEPIDLLTRLPAGTVLNLNAPALPPEEVRGVRWASLDRFGRVRVALHETSERWLQMEYRTNQGDLDPECDTALLEQGYATLTALQGISEVPHGELAEQETAPRAEAAIAEVPD
jgi:5'-nucleotidase